MKKLLFFILLITVTNVLNAQEDDFEIRKGYVGLGVGPTFLTKSYSNVGTGIQANINFGYLLSDYIGITASFLSTTFELSNYSDRSVGLTGFMVGPLFSTYLNNSPKFELDLRPTVGYVKGSVSIGSLSGNTKEGSFAAGAGGSFRWNLWRLFSLSANIDYYYGKIDDLNLSSVGITIGASYRIK